MFRRFRNLSCFLSAVHASGELETLWGPYTELAKVRDGTVKNEAFMTENYIERDGDAALALYVAFETYDTRSYFDDGSLIQSYMQRESQSRPGLYYSVTCNVGYDSSKSKASGSAI